MFLYLASTCSIPESLQPQFQSHVHTRIGRTRHPMILLEMLNSNPLYRQPRCLRTCVPFAGHWRFQILVGPMLCDKHELLILKRRWESETRKLVPRVAWALREFDSNHELGLWCGEKDKVLMIKQCISSCSDMDTIGFRRHLCRDMNLEMNQVNEPDFSISNTVDIG